MIYKRNPLILAYHSISRHRNDNLSVNEKEFEKHLIWLKNKNYKVLSVEDAYKSKENKVAVITFDDGYRDNYEFAFPLLMKYGFVATIFLTANYINTEKIYHWDKKKLGLYGKEESFKILDWNQIIEMKKYGIIFGSHTNNHKILTNIPLEESYKEITNSKKILEEKLNSDVNLFCYPEGKMNNKIIDQVQEAGYDFGLVTPPMKGIPDSKFTLKRVGIYHKTSMFQFKIKTKAIIQKLIEYSRKDYYQF